MTQSDLYSGIGLLVVAHVGMFLLAGLLPFIAAFILDGVVQVLRNNGLRFFFLAIGFSVVIAGTGYVLYQCGNTSSLMTSAARASLTQLGGVLLVFSIPLGILAFLIRTAKLLLRSRHSPPRPGV